MIETHKDKLIKHLQILTHPQNIALKQDGQIWVDTQMSNMPNQNS